METIIRPATIKDWNYINALNIREIKSLGFIPKDTFISILSRLPTMGYCRWKNETILVTVDNGDLTGYCYSSYSGSTAKIIQIVIQEDARRWQRATLLEGEVRREAIRRSKSGITCRVACDLESNLYWRSMGYILIKQVISTNYNRGESKNKRPLWIYYLPLNLPMFLTMEGIDNV